MKTILMISALLALPFAAHADPSPDMANAPFPAVVTSLDFDSAQGDEQHQKYGCQLSTTSDDKIRLRYIPSETSVERMSVRDGAVKGKTKVALTKLTEENGVVVYGYREANAIVLVVPAMDSFSTITGSGDRLFMQQTCGLGITLLFTKPPANDMGCDTHEGKTHFPGFCGKLARLDGRITSTLAFSMSAGLGEHEKVRVLVKSHATKPDGTTITEP